MYGSVAAWISSGESRSEKSKTGLRVVSTRESRGHNM
jgi:hypothetical protein